MNKRAVGFALGKLLQVMSGTMLVPLFIAVYHLRDLPSIRIMMDPQVIGFITAVFFSLIGGTALIVIGREFRDQIRVREGYAICTIGWLICSAIGAIPFFAYFISFPDQFSGGIWQQYVDAFFETMSGFTTTGSTILTDIESMPRGLLFWRGMTQWLGGMGIVTLALAIFPAMGIAGYQMYKGEVPGPTKDRLQPRLAETAKILWSVYILLTALEVLFLALSGMTLFDAVCHTFGSMSDGGFSTKNMSIGFYDSRFIHWTIMIFSYLASLNFTLHYRFLVKRDYGVYWNESEFRFYIILTLSVIFIFTMMLYFKGLPDAEILSSHYRSTQRSPEEVEAYLSVQQGRLARFGDCFQESAFAVIMVVTTTGFVSADFDLWPEMCRFLLMALMICGGCAGSAAGGLKAIRILTALKAAYRELTRLANPRLITSLRINQIAIADDRVLNILVMIVLYLFVVLLASVIMMLFMPDLLTAVSSVLATVGNIGPGMNGVGAMENYHWIPLPGKIILSLCMLFGRLEIFSVLIAFRPSIWKK